MTHSTSQSPGYSAKCLPTNSKNLHPPLPVQWRMHPCGVGGFRRLKPDLENHIRSRRSTVSAWKIDSFFMMQDRLALGVFFPMEIYVKP